MTFTRRHLLIAPAVIALAFALEWFIITDKEKIETIMDTVVEATKQEQAEDIIKYISPDYRDGLHPSRELFAAHCRQIFNQPQIEKHAFRSQKLDIQKSRATVWITIYTWFNQRSQWIKAGSPAKTLWRLELSKQPDKTWLFDRIELIEWNDQPVDWSVVK